jgi:hypothetical protein
MAFSVLTAFIPSISICVGSLLISSIISLAPFFAGAFLSSFLGALPPLIFINKVIFYFLFLSSTISSSPLNILNVSAINFSNLGYILGSSSDSRGGSVS